MLWKDHPLAEAEVMAVDVPKWVVAGQVEECQCPEWAEDWVAWEAADPEWVAWAVADPE